MYDNDGDAFGFLYNNTPYYYVKNAQNDIILIMDADGQAVVLYMYDAWGNVTQCFDGTEENLAAVNPILYRSYYYDAEMSMYYLNSRYYVPALCRFLNADGFTQTGQGLLDKNMFAYCGNNPVNRADTNGNKWADIKQKISNAWNRFTNWVDRTFGVNLSSTGLLDESVNYPIPSYMPISVKHGMKVSKTTNKYGDASKSVTAYANLNKTYKIKSSSVGIKIRCSNAALKINLALDDISISGSVTDGNTTNSFGLKINISELAVGVEKSTEIRWDDECVTTYTDVSVNGLFVAAAYYAVTTGQPSPSFQPQFA